MKNQLAEKVSQDKVEKIRAENLPREKTFTKLLRQVNAVAKGAKEYKRREAAYHLLHTNFDLDYGL